MFIKDEAVDEYGNPIRFMIISIGIDYGATEGETEFKATGITQYFKEVWTIDELKMAGLHTPEDMYKQFIEFYKRVVAKYGKVTHCFADYGALGQVITFGMNKYLQQKGIPLQVKDCKYLIEAYKLAVWDDKHEDTRLDDGTTPIDDLDASEYSMFYWYDKLMMNIRER